jgi:hypothetical protein
MKPNPKFLDQGLGFWAIVKYVSEQAGYTNRKSKANPISTLKVLTPDTIRATLTKCDIDHGSIPTEQYDLASEYIAYRAAVLTHEVEPSLMNRDQARACFEEVKERVNPKHPIPLNRQKGEKRHEAYLSALVGMLAEEAVGYENLVNDTQKLSILTENGSLKGIFSRRFDGAIPSTRDPIAMWEIKEYYGTKSFGSRVADGVYETLLDGYEVNAFEAAFGRRISHYLFVDDWYTWWYCGKSYLCRLIDMLHTGHVDELFFGRQVIEQWPQTLAEIQARLPVGG